MEKQNREAGLDLLKILATILIIFHHYQQITGVVFNQGNDFYNGPFYFGYMCELFFIISGTLMYPYIDRIKNKNIDFKSFFKRRYFRLVPVMALGAILFSIFSVIFWNRHGIEWYGIKITLRGIMVSILGIQSGWFVENPGINNPSWYISVLILCYIIFYVLTWFSNRCHLSPQFLYAVMIVWGIVIKICDINLPFINVDAARGYEAFFWGVMISGLYNRKHECEKILLCVFGIVAITLWMVFDYSSIKHIIEHVLIFIYFPSIMVVMKELGKRMNKGKQLIYLLSKVSYCVYVMHMPVFVLGYIILNILPRGSVILENVSTMLITTLICWGVGAIIYFVYELPIEKVINKKRGCKKTALS